MRADARRNRDAVLRQAEVLFTERGFDVPLDEIAAAAEVSIATLYRHFASREALIEALVEHKLTPIAQHTAAVVDGTGDRLEALWSVMAFSAQRHTTDRALAQLWRTVEDDTINNVARSIGLWDATDRLLVQCHEARVVREEVTVADLARTFYALGGVVEAGHGAHWRSFLATHVQGMLAPGQTVPRES